MVEDLTVLGTKVVENFFYDCGVVFTACVVFLL